VKQSHLLTMFSFLFIFPVFAFSATLTVDQGGTGDYLVIQQAIVAASVGDTVLVKDGVYTGLGNHTLDLMGKDIVVLSENGPANCEINCEENRGFVFDEGESPLCIVDGFTVNNPNAFGEHDGTGGGFRILNDSSPTVRNCIIVNGIGYWGCGVGIDGGAPRFEDCEIRDCWNSWGGGAGVEVSGAAVPVFVRCLIVNNTTGWGPGVLGDWNSIITLDNCTIADNYALASGSARNVTAWHGAEIILNNCIVYGGGTAQMNASPFNDAVITAQYCCVEGGFTGTGNILSNPMFVGGGDYNLTELSPCIDTGNPNILDPDGSISDIGAYCYCEESPVANFLSWFDVRPYGEGTVVEWSVSEIMNADQFVVLREDERSGFFRPITSVEIVSYEEGFRLFDSNQEPSSTYRYRVSVSTEGTSWVLFTTDHIVTSTIPLALRQNHPNPFNPSTTIKFSLPESCPVSLVIYDVSGRLVKTLIGGEVVEAGHREKRWDGLDNSGRMAPAGVYFAKMSAGEFVDVRRMALVK
jgi:hypothetical protein